MSRLLVFPPDIGLPETGPAVLHVPLVVVHSHGGVVRVVAPGRNCLTRDLVVKLPVREAVVDSPVPGPAGQCGDAGNPGDEGEGGDDLPPHPDKQATL